MMVPTRRKPNGDDDSFYEDKNSSNDPIESPRPALARWHVVDNDDESTLPPIDQVVWIIYLSGYDDGPVIQLGGRTLVDDLDTYGWDWGTLDGDSFAKNWEPKLYGIDVDDDYRVTHWAALEWPSSESPDVWLADVLLLCTECKEPIKARINTPNWIRCEWIGPEGECLRCLQKKKEAQATSELKG